MPKGTCPIGARPAPSVSGATATASGGGATATCCRRHIQAASCAQAIGCNERAIADCCASCTTAPTAQGCRERGCKSPPVGYVGV